MFLRWLHKIIDARIERAFAKQQAREDLRAQWGGEWADYLDGRPVTMSEAMIWQAGSYAQYLHKCEDEERQRRVDDYRKRREAEAARQMKGLAP